jgi:tRNA A37 methylthiotransferase MiaB
VDLGGLLAALVALPELRRLRLSSLYPGKLGPNLIELVGGHPKICKHLHLPIQSGADPVLKAMRRGYTAADILGSVAKLRDRCPGLGLTADILVGFPGETDADVEATESVIATCGFHKLHLFPFSVRPGTPAEKLPPLPEAVIEARMARLRAFGDRLFAASLQDQVGRETEVVLESTPRNGGWRALTETYHPVRLTGAEWKAGTAARIRVTGVADGELIGVAA